MSRMVDIFKMLRSSDMLVFKNTKLPTCVYMLFVSKRTRHMFIDLELAPLGLELVVYWLWASQDSLQPFSVRWITLAITSLKRTLSNEASHIETLHFLTSPTSLKRTHDTRSSKFFFKIYFTMFLFQLTKNI